MQEKASVNPTSRAQEIASRIKHKIVFLGNQFVGKTSIIERFIYNVFDEKTQVQNKLIKQPTVGIDFLAKTVKIEDRQIRLLLWDTAGQERFHSLIPSYLRDASCAIIVFDITSHKSFEGVEGWYKKVRTTRGNEALIVLLGNKVDAVDLREVPYDEANKYAGEREILFFEVSAKLSTNVETVFTSICLQLPADNSFLITQSQFINQSAFDAASSRQLPEKQKSTPPASNSNTRITLGTPQIKPVEKRSGTCC